MHSFWSNHGLFQYVQLFVISNGVNTKYLANNKLQSVKQTFFWADANNKNITNLPEFTAAFLSPEHLGKMIAHYIVINETHKVMMVLRPYQYFATEAIIHQVKNSNDNAYIWHTTGSGKTLTSFKASQILMELPEVYKVVFVVDRKDLDYQTMNEFNAFKKDSVDVTNNTQSLVRQLTDNTKLVLTTIQKLNNAISERFSGKIEALRHQKIVFIFDECHRSQFGDTHDRITKFFEKSQLIGFTGTPIFSENASKNEYGKRTTKDLFGNCLHKYVITDAIKDQNVLRFGIEYIGKYKNKSNTFIDIEVEDIDKQEVLDSEKRINKIVDYIIAYHNKKTFERDYSSLLAVSSIDNLIKYYDLFQKKKEAGEHDLRIATIFTYGTNEDSDEAQDFLPSEEVDFDVLADPKERYQSSHTRDKLEKYIGDYNKMYGTSFSTKDSQQFENYFKNISQRLKDREKQNFNQEKDRLDIVIVVNMMLTGFDAKKVNTLYVDKNLKYHGLIQAFSRTNRILNADKPFGNIVCFRNLKQATDKALALFSNKAEAEKIVLIPSFESIKEKYNAAVAELLKIAPDPDKVLELPTEEQQLQYVKAFREVMRINAQLENFVEYDQDDTDLNKAEFQKHTSQYKYLYTNTRVVQPKDKVSVLNDVNFQLELIHKDTINVGYILNLLQSAVNNTDQKQKQKYHAQVQDLLENNHTLYDKQELIQKFLDENIPRMITGQSVEEAFAQFWDVEKERAIDELCQKEAIKPEVFKQVIGKYEYTKRLPSREDVTDLPITRPKISERKTLMNTLVVKTRQFIDKFYTGL